jgi:hypothetical protein
MIYFIVAIIAIFILIFLGIFLIPFLGTGILFGYVLKNSLQKKSPEFLEKEKLEMEVKVSSIMSELEPWKKFSVADITNNLQYSFRKWMANVITGKMLSRDGSPVMVFQRIDRGIYVDSRTIARSTDFKIYFEYKGNENLIYFNDKYFGKIINNCEVVNSLHERVAVYYRKMIDEQGMFTVEFTSKNKYKLAANYDRKVFVTNPFYDRPSSPIPIKRRLKVYRDPGPSFSLVEPIDIDDPNEKNWVIVIAVFEAIYFGFDFTS